MYDGVMGGQSVHVWREKAMRERKIFSSVRDRASISATVSHIYL